MTRTSPGWATLALAAAVALAGCAEDFAPYNRLDALRVLAIQSEPVAPGPGETTTLTPLVYAPGGEDTVSYAWSWCPFAGSAADGYPCLVTEEQLAMLGGQAGAMVPPFDLGEEPTASLEHLVDPAILELICAGTPGAPVRPDCEGGFPVQVKLTVTTDDEQLVTVRSLRLRFDPDDEPNENPRIDGLFALVDGAEQPLDDSPSITLPRDRETRIAVDVDEDVAEIYTGRDDRGEPVSLRERLVLTWFVESGETASVRTSFIDEVVPLERATENGWEPAAIADDSRETARLIVVIRDNRGGVAWRSGTVALEGAP